MRWEDRTDLGSIEYINSTDNKIEFQLLEADIDKLPTNVPAGSSVFVLDTKAVYIFHEQSKTWIEL